MKNGISFISPGMSGKIKKNRAGKIMNGAAAAMLFAACFGIVSISHAQSPSELLRDSLQIAPATEADSALPESGLPERQAPGLSLPAQSATNNPFEIEAPAIPKTPEEIEAEIRERAFNAAITGLLPLRPPEMRELLETYDETKQAVEVPVYPYPEPEIAIETVSLDPGTKPPMIKVGKNLVTTLTVVDITGAPWPIRDLTFAGNFEVIQPDPGDHVVRITPMSDFAYGNISVQLLEMETPVTFILKAARDAVHYRFDARIPEYGPYADMPIIQGGITLAAGDESMANLLEGVAPPNVEKLDVVGVDGRTTAYNVDDMTYVRTPLTLLSPGWESSVSSADGMNVYALARTPVLLLSNRGEIVRARLVSEESTGE